MNQDFTYGRNFADFLGSFWSSIFDKGALGSAIGYASSENLVQMYMDMVDVINRSSIYSVPVFSRQNVYPVVLHKSKFVNYSEYPEYGAGGFYGEQPQDSRYKIGSTLQYGTPAYLSSAYFYPFSNTEVSSLGVFALNRLFEPSVTLANMSDFMQVPDGIVFKSNPFDNPLFPSRQILDVSTGEIDEEIIVWFCDVDKEKYILHKQFGYTFTNYKTSSLQYKKIIQTVFELVSNGPSLFRLDAFLSAIAGSPLIREAHETVESISVTPEGTIVVTDYNVYQIDPSLDLRPEVSVGTVLKGGFPLLDIVTIVDTRQDNWWGDMDSIPVMAGTFTGVDQFLSFPNQSSPVTYIYGPDTPSGKYKGVSFPLIGTPDTVGQFWKNVIEVASANDVSYGTNLISKYGPSGAGKGEFDAGTPFVVNPAQVFAEDLAKSTILMLRVQLTEVSNIDRFFKTIGILAPSCPVHLRLMLFLEMTGNLDRLPISSEQSSVSSVDLKNMALGTLSVSEQNPASYNSVEAVSIGSRSFRYGTFTGALQGPNYQPLEKIDLSSDSVIVQNIELKQIPKCIA